MEFVESKKRNIYFHFCKSLPLCMGSRRLTFALPLNYLLNARNFSNKTKCCCFCFSSYYSCQQNKQINKHKSRDEK